MADMIEATTTSGLRGKIGQHYDAASTLAMKHGYKSVSEALRTIREIHSTHPFSLTEIGTIIAGHQQFQEWIGTRKKEKAKEQPVGVTTQPMLPATTKPYADTYSKPLPRPMERIKGQVGREVLDYYLRRLIGKPVAVSTWDDDDVLLDNAQEAGNDLWQLARQIGAQAFVVADAYGLRGEAVYTAIDDAAQQEVLRQVATIRAAMRAIQNAVVALDKVNATFLVEEEGLSGTPNAD